VASFDGFARDACADLGWSRDELEAVFAEFLPSPEHPGFVWLVREVLELAPAKGDVA
jgi:hypothetical protein